MKKLLVASLTGVLVCVLMLSSMLTAFAADDSTVNGVAAPVGSTVEYTLYLESYKQDVVGIQMVFKFDTAHLELKNVDLKNFSSATLNANSDNDGMIYFNNSDLNAKSFAKADELAKLTFEVKGKGSSNIEYYIQYLYDIDLVNIYDYTLTYSLSVDGQTEIKDKTPVLADAAVLATEVGDFDSGDFANNPEGTGSGIKPVVVTNAATASNQSAADSSDENSNLSLYIIAGVVVVLLAGVIVLVIVKKNNSEQ